MRNSEVRVSHLFVKRNAKLVKYGDKTKTENENESDYEEKRKGKANKRTEKRWKMEDGDRKSIERSEV